MTFLFFLPVFGCSFFRIQYGPFPNAQPAGCCQIITRSQAAPVQDHRLAANHLRTAGYWRNWRNRTVGRNKLCDPSRRGGRWSKHSEPNFQRMQPERHLKEPPGKPKTPQIKGQTTYQLVQFLDPTICDEFFLKFCILYQCQTNCD